MTKSLVILYLVAVLASGCGTTTSPDRPREPVQSTIPRDHEAEKVSEETPREKTVRITEFNEVYESPTPSEPPENLRAIEEASEAVEKAPKNPTAPKSPKTDKAPKPEESSESSRWSWIGWTLFEWVGSAIVSLIIKRPTRIPRIPK